MPLTAEEHGTLVGQVFAYDYYVASFNKVRKKYIDRGMDMCTPYFWNDFWMELPDSPAIRREPFYAICDIAERIYDEKA